jgi:hypothetical protein
MENEYLQHNIGGITEVGSRKRVNYGVTSTGKPTWDCTVELFNKTNEEVVAELKDLISKIKEATGA